MNKTNLKFELDLDFVLVAITTQLKDYMFCFKTNKQLGTDFSKIADLELPFNTDEDPFYFSRYFFLLPESETELYILLDNSRTATCKFSNFSMHSITGQRPLQYFQIIWFQKSRFLFINPKLY